MSPVLVFGLVLSVFGILSINGVAFNRHWYWEWSGLVEDKRNASAKSYHLLVGSFSLLFGSLISIHQTLSANLWISFLLSVIITMIYIKVNEYVSGSNIMSLSFLESSKKEKSDDKN